MIPDVHARHWLHSPKCGPFRRMFDLGQLFAHLGFLGEVHIGRGLGYIEDDELIAILYRHRAELESRLQNTHEPADHEAAASTSVSGSPTIVEAAQAAELGR